MRTRYTFTLLVVLVHAAYAAEPQRQEVHPLQTLTLTDQQVLTGVQNGPRATIGGVLQLPTRGPAPVPAVVIVHGSGGMLGGDLRWTRELIDMGIAVFLIDSFTGRGIIDTTTDQSQLDQLAAIVDAYRALERLSTHPLIDRDRIAIMGGSRGGVTALYSSLARLAGAYAAPGTRFAAHLPFYTNCNTTFLDDTNVIAPIHMFHGTADDVAPIDACRQYVARLRGAGREASLTEYPGVRHAFDSPSALPQRLERAETPATCALVERPRGRLVNRDTGQPFTSQDACIRRGVTIGYDAAAHAMVLGDVRRVLARIFGHDAPQ